MPFKLQNNSRHWWISMCCFFHIVFELEHWIRSRFRFLAHHQLHTAYNYFRHQMFMSTVITMREIESWQASTHKIHAVIQIIIGLIWPPLFLTLPFHEINQSCVRFGNCMRSWFAFVKYFRSVPSNKNENWMKLPIFKCSKWLKQIFENGIKNSFNEKWCPILIYNSSPVVNHFD